MARATKTDFGETIADAYKTDGAAKAGKQVEREVVRGVFGLLKKRI